MGLAPVSVHSYLGLHHNTKIPIG